MDPPPPGDPRAPGLPPKLSCNKECPIPSSSSKYLRAGGLGGKEGFLGSHKDLEARLSPG